VKVKKKTSVHNLVKVIKTHVHNLVNIHGILSTFVLVMDSAEILQPDVKKQSMYQNKADYPLK